MLPLPGLHIVKVLGVWEGSKSSTLLHGMAIEQRWAKYSRRDRPAQPLSSWLGRLTPSSSPAVAPCPTASALHATSALGGGAASSCRAAWLREPPSCHGALDYATVLLAPTRQRGCLSWCSEWHGKGAGRRGVDRGRGSQGTGSTVHPGQQWAERGQQPGLWPECQ